MVSKIHLYTRVHSIVHNRPKCPALDESRLETQHLKTEIMASGPITSWQMEGRKVVTVTDLFSWAPESLWTETAAMKLKDACSLEGKL